MKITPSVSSAALLFVTINVQADAGLDADTGYQWMTELAGEWRLAPDTQQRGKATQHTLVAPLLGTDQTAMAFKTIGKGSTVQEDLLPDNPKQMVTMYHCEDGACDQLRATHYCVKQNQPRLLANLDESTAQTLIFDCDMDTALCASDEDHVHRITHSLSDDGNQLTTTYVSWKDGEYRKESVYVFERKD
jgi:hypothetical protein